MAQGVLSFKYEEEKRDTGMTALAGLPVYMDLASVMGIAESVARHEQLRVLEEALALLPEGVETVRLRSDTAGYQHALLCYCEKGGNTRFGRIEFAIGCDVTPEFKKAVLEVEESEWAPIHKVFDGVPSETNQQWAEVCFIPDAIAPIARKRLCTDTLPSVRTPFHVVVDP